MRSKPKQGHTTAPWRGWRRARLGIVMAAAVAALLTEARAAPTVATDTGIFTGVPSPSDPAAVNVFFGIRYALAPVGNLRWTPPQPPISPAGPTVAAVPGPACPQAGSTAPLPQSEDCLFLNIYVPATAQPNANLPVMLWIHGGALVSGSGAQYDPSVMAAANNIIVVTINYRLGALGWLVEPGLLAQTPSAFENIGDGGNYGLMDQQFAMQWTQRNIARFGGDPRKVTIAGESAGGLSVSSNLASITTAPGLFRHAIIESGAYMLHDLPSEAVYEALFAANFDAALGCTQPNDAPCLRAASVTAILNAQAKVFGSFGISPDFGTKILPRSLEQAFATGEFIRVPVLQGTNANEGRLFEPSDIPFASTLANIVAAGGPANFDLMNPNAFCAVPQGTGVPTVCSYPQEISLFLGAIGFPAADNSASFAASLAEDYPLAKFPDPFLPNNAPSADEALSQIFTDLVFACNGLDSNVDLSQRVTVFAYEFNDPNAPPLGGSVVKAPNDVFGFPSAAEHAAELQFLFNFGTPLSADEQQLAGEMKTYWGNFVTTGDPNLPRHVPLWFSFAPTAVVQELIPGPGEPHPSFDFSHQHLCRIWQPFVATEAQR